MGLFILSEGVSMKKILIILTAIFLSLGLAACNASNSIVGEWGVTVNGEVKTLTYKDDGVYTVVNKDGVVEEEGTYEVEGDKLTATSAYKIVGDERLNLQEDSDGVLTFSIKGNTLTLTSKDGDTLDLKRK